MHTQDTAAHRGYQGYVVNHSTLGTTRPQRDRRLTHLAEKDLVTVGSVCVHRVYVIPESNQGRKRERKREGGRGDTRSDSSRQSKNSTNNKAVPLPPSVFSPAGSKQRQKMGLCVNFVQTSRNDNKQKGARAICSVRQKQSTKVESAAAQPRGQKPLCPGERSRWGVREEGKV